MIFSSPIFLFWFLPVVYLVYQLLPGIRSRNGRLTLASLVFYTFGQFQYLPLLLASILMNYLLGLLLMSGRWRRAAMFGAAVCNLLLLGVFKYLDFFFRTVNTLAGLSLPLPGIVLPIGVSFYTFQGLSYVIDVCREPKSGTRSLGKLILYISFFPQLIAGPIIKYHDVSLQIDQRRTTPEDTLFGLKRLITGLGKKLLLSNTAGMAAVAHLSQLLVSGLPLYPPWRQPQRGAVYRAEQAHRLFHHGTVARSQLDLCAVGTMARPVCLPGGCGHHPQTPAEQLFRPRVYHAGSGAGLHPLPC